MERSVVIIGAGVFGASAALELARRGWRVTLVEPGPPRLSRGSSYDVSKVVRMDYGADDFYTGLMGEAMPLWEQWNEERRAAGLARLFHRDGFLLIREGGIGPGDFEHESRVRIEAAGFATELIDVETLRAKFPVWAGPENVTGYFNPHAGWAESGEATLDLIRRAEAAGAVVVEGRRLVRLIERGSHVVGAELAGPEKPRDRIEADLTIVAAGAWTPVILPELLPMMRPVGQPVVFLRAGADAASIERYRPPWFSCWAADISRTGWYGFPALADGTLKIGRHGPGFEIDPERVLAGEAEIPKEHEAHTREFLRQWLPGLAGAPLVGTRVCLYCDSWDGDFYIDHHPDRPGLFVAAGGSGHGFKFAPILGGIIVDRVEGVENPAHGRFKWRTPAAKVKEHARWTGE